MAKSLQASQLILPDLKARFQLHQNSDPDFFPEWQGCFADLTPAEQQWLDRVKSDSLRLSEYSLHEEIVKIQTGLDTVWMLRDR